MIKNRFLFLAILFTVAGILVLYYGKNQNFDFDLIRLGERMPAFAAKDFPRDFYRFNCQNRLRVGGPAAFIANVPHKLYRTEG